MGKIDDLIKELCPDGVKYVKLGEICEIYDGTHQTPKYVNEGIPFISVENIQNIYGSQKFISIDDYNSYKIKPQLGDMFMTRIGTIGTCAIVNKQEDIAYYVSLALLRPNHSIVNVGYLKHLIESNIGVNEIRKHSLLHAVPIKINKNDICKIQIPLPPLSIQQQIVEILDTFTDSISNLQEELALREKQMEYYRENLLSFDGEEVEWKTLKDVAEIGTGSSNTKDGLSEGLYPFYTRGQEILRKNEYEYDEEAIITAGDGVGVGKVIHYTQGKYALHQRAYRFSPMSNLSCKFLFYYMKVSFFQYVCGNSVSSSVSSLRKPKLMAYPIPVPSLSRQQEIVDILDTFESMIANIKEEIELRQKQYEYYREKLLTFD